jgi:hypothetical protein
MSFVRRKRGQVLLVHNERDAGSARVRQRELHRFASPSKLEEVLASAGWTRWTRTIAWRENELEFDWPAIRERLSEELKAWRAAPSGAKHRRNMKIERLASELVVELAPLSVAKASDAAGGSVSDAALPNCSSARWSSTLSMLTPTTISASSVWKRGS